MLSTHRRGIHLVCIAFALLVMVVAMIGFSPHAKAAPASYSGPTLRLPWLNGTHQIGGFSYGCGDHDSTFDQDALDFDLGYGTPVTAVFAGTVTTDPNQAGGYGNTLWVTNGSYRAVYAHLSGFAVSNGVSVSQGQVVGYSGSAGSGPHLHFSLRNGGSGAYDGTAVVPEPMSGYTGFGHYGLTYDLYQHYSDSYGPVCGFNKSGEPNYNPEPGGWWIGPTPSDFTTISSGSQVQVNFRMNDNNNGGLNHGDITYWDSSSNRWQVASGVKTTFYSDGTADVYVVLTMPNAFFEVSVNVYANDNSYQLAPSGIRHYCTQTSCLASNFPSGGSSVGTVAYGGSNATVFEDFSNGIGNWSALGSVASTTDGPNTFMRFTPASQSSAEAWKDVRRPALSAYNTITLQINLHGATLLGNDASALYLDQGGSWKFVALSNYVQQGLDGWQTATVPLKNFQGFDQTASFDRLGFRFWVSSASTIDVGEILFSLNETATQPFTVYDEALAANWGDWSWCSNNNLADTSHPLSGSKDISWIVTCAYGGLALHLPSGFDTTSFGALTFALEASQSGQRVQVSFYDSAGNTGSPVQLDNYGGTPVTGVYTVYSIPVSAFHSTGTITGVLIQDISGNSTEPPMYVDRMMFQ